MFTSEGCNSCPPADAWLNDFIDHPDLFKRLIPVAFHVDYWNWLGWQDPFSDKTFSDRQYAYVKSKHLSQAYTPGFLINNQEWREWFSGQRQWTYSLLNPGILTATIRDDQVNLSFQSSKQLIGHFVVLGMGLTSQVKGGENRGRQFTHHFVVLDWQQKTGQSTWQFKRPDLESLPDAERFAIAAWLEDEQTNSIIQAVGGYLPTP